MAVLTDYLEDVRLLIGDLEPSTQMYEEGTLITALKSTMRVTPSLGLAVGDDLVTLTTVPSANQEALLVLHCAKILKSTLPDKYSWKTRAGAESYGGWVNILDTLDERIHGIESGDGFTSHQSFSSWLRGQVGLSPAESMVSMTGTPNTFSVPYP